MQSLAKHLFNENVSFFSSPDYEEIRSYVQQYLLKNSKLQQSLIESTGRRGYYRLNTANNADAQQLMFSFRNQQEESVDDTLGSSIDLSLDLFADEPK